MRRADSRLGCWLFWGFSHCTGPQIRRDLPFPIYQRSGIRLSSRKHPPPDPCSPIFSSTHHSRSFRCRDFGSSQSKDPTTEARRAQLCRLVEGVLRVRGGEKRWLMRMASIQRAEAEDEVTEWSRKQDTSFLTRGATQQSDTDILGSAAMSA